MCVDCVIEHEEFCQNHVNMCVQDDCTMCNAIWRDVRDGKIVVNAPEGK